jgi:translation initiation factor IF-2
MAESKSKRLNVLVKADVDGSLKSLVQSLETLGNDEVKVKIVGQGIGAINESDISLSESAGAQIIGFNVNLPIHIKQLAQRTHVGVRLYKVIYELLDDLKADLSNLLEPEVVETKSAELSVKGVFRITQKTLICGGAVTDGKIRAGMVVKWLKGEELVEIGTLNSVQKEQAEVKEVAAGEMCGLNIDTKSKANLKIDDKLEFYERSVKERSLD